MSKELYIEAHEAAVERYLDQHPDADWLDAYDRTADQAYDDMRELMAGRIDAARDRMKEQRL